MKELKTIEDIYKKYDLRKESKFLYDDITFNLNGTDYSKYMKFFKTEIKEYIIKDFYTPNHWYILCYLISKSTDNVYLETTINNIAKDLNYKAFEISTNLQQMIKKKLIFIKCKKYTNSNLLKIAINYNIINHKDDNNFICIPCDFIKAVLPNISIIQWSIFTILCAFYNNLLNSNSRLTQISCSNITQETIAELVGIKDLRTVRNNIKKLEHRNEPLVISNKNYYIDANFILYKGNDNRNKIIQVNKVYNILLFETIEYNYYYNYLMNKDNNITCADEKSFILLFYKNLMEEYEECLNTNDSKQYKKLKINKIKAKDNNDKYFEFKKDGILITEKDLENFLIKNLHLIEDGMKFIDNQYNTEFGRIDILSKDKNNNTCIIELKIKDNDRRLVTQCSTYPLGFENEDKIRMITIAPDYKDFLLKPLLKIPNIEIYKYNILNNDLQTLNINKIN